MRDIRRNGRDRAVLREISRFTFNTFSKRVSMIMYSIPNAKLTCDLNWLQKSQVCLKGIFNQLSMWTREVDFLGHINITNRFQI